MTSVDEGAIYLSLVGDRSPTVVATGELDVLTVSQLRSCFAQAVATGANRVTVDLSAVSFIDSSSLAVLAHFYREMQGRDGQLVVTSVSPIAMRVLEITGMSVLVDTQTAGGGSRTAAG